MAPPEVLHLAHRIPRTIPADPRSIDRSQICSRMIARLEGHADGLVAPQAAAGAIARRHDVGRRGSSRATLSSSREAATRVVTSAPSTEATTSQAEHARPGAKAYCTAVTPLPQRRRRSDWRRGSHTTNTAASRATRKRWDLPSRRG